MDVAVVSVISSAMVAVGGLAVTWASGRSQRSHEARLAYEGRVWEAKSVALYALISVCTEVSAVAAAPGRRHGKLTQSLYESRYKLAANVGPVRAYAGDEVGQALASMLRTVDAALSESFDVIRMMVSKERKEKAIEEERFDVAAQHRSIEVELGEQLDAHGAAFAGDLVLASEALISAARRDLGSSGDRVGTRRWRGRGS